ncbi:mspA family protein, partial [Rhodococcus sp. NPDC056960]
MIVQGKSGLRRGARIAGLGGAAAALLGVMSTGAASADTFIPLPDGSKTGPNVTVTRTAE